MKRPTFLTRVKGALGGWRHPLIGYGMGHATNGGVIPKSWDWNFWQEGRDPLMMDCCAAVEAGVSAYAQTVAMLPGTVWRKDDNGGRTEMPMTPLAKILAKPNDYQTRSDFIMNQVRALYFRGNCYAIAEKRGGVPVALHPVHPDYCAPYVNRETNDIFWSLAPTDLTPGMSEWPVETSRLIPDEYVWHVHMATPFHPLCGVSPLTSACMSIAANCGMNAQVNAFLANMSRPSGTLNTDLKLSADAVEELRARWKEHSSGAGIGGTPILTHGLKWTPLELSAPDTQLIDFYKLSIADIARALRVPLPLIGVMDSATFNNAEVLMQFWKASGLGWLLEHIELSLDKFFDLPRDQYCELDADALLRSEFKSRIDALVRGVQGGVFSPNEARATEGLPAVDGGDMPRVQQQLVALDWEPPEPAAPAAPAEPPANDPPPDAGESTADDDAPLERAVEALAMIVHGLRRDVAAMAQPVALPIQRDFAEVADGPKTRRRLDKHRREISELRDDLAALRTEHADALARIAGLSAALDARPRDLSLADVFRGTWSIEEIYARGDIVATPAGGMFIAQALTHDFPVDDSEEWRRLTPDNTPGKDGASMVYRGVFVAGTEYERGDVVCGPDGAGWVWTGERAASIECPGDAWGLLVKQGRTGRGRPGPRGLDAPFPTGLAWEGDDLLMFLSSGRVLRAEGRAP